MIGGHDPSSDDVDLDYFIGHLPVILSRAASRVIMAGTTGSSPGKSPWDKARRTLHAVNLFFQPTRFPSPRMISAI
jgi:hypothetical protein